MIKLEVPKFDIDLDKINPNAKLFILNVTDRNGRNNSYSHKLVQDKIALKLVLKGDTKPTIYESSDKPHQLDILYATDYLVTLHYVRDQDVYEWLVLVF